MPTLMEQVQVNIRTVTGTSGMYWEDWHALCDIAGIAKGQTDERVLAYYNKASNLSATFSSAYNYFLLNPSVVTNVALAAQVAAMFSSGQQGAWYDPSDFTTLFQDSSGTVPVAAVGQSVGLMLDKSGRGNHASQATAAARPVLQIDGGGKYYLAFDGIDDALNVPDAPGLRQAVMSFFIGINPVALGSREDWVSCGDSSTYPTNNFIIGNSASGLQVFPRSPQSPQPMGALVANSRNVITITADGTNILSRINSAAGASVAAVLGTDNTLGLSIGGRNPTPSNMFLYSLIIRGVSSSAAQISSAEAYANSKTGAY